jgi:MFS family permease
MNDYTQAQRITIIVSCMLGFALDLYDVLLLPFLMPAIQRSLSMTVTEIASITSLTLIGSVMGGALFGWIGDRLGRKTSLQLTLGLFAVGSILSAFSTNYLTLAALRFLTGIGLGGEWGAGMVLFNETWNPRRRGLGAACIQGSAAFASAAASIVAVWALTTFDPEWGWRVGLLTGGAPLVLIIAVRIWMPESKAWLAFDERRRGTAPPETRATPSLACSGPDCGASPSRRCPG